MLQADHLKLQRLKQDIQNLTKEHQAICDQKSGAIGLLEIRLQRQLENIEKEIQDKESELLQLEKEQENSFGVSASPDPLVVQDEIDQLPGGSQGFMTPLTPLNQHPIASRDNPELVYDLKFSEILSSLNTHFSNAPENITDSRWINWFQEMFELQYSALQRISYKVGQLLNAHRTTVYFIADISTRNNTEVQQELWSIVAQGTASLEIRVPFGEGVSGLSTGQKSQSIVILFDL